KTRQRNHRRPRCHCVLNARRHCRVEDMSWTMSVGWKWTGCSTPEGIAGLKTPSSSPRKCATKIAVLNARRHCRVEDMTARMPSSSKMRRCSTPEGIAGLKTATLRQRSRFLESVLNARRHCRVEDETALTYIDPLSGCSTPEGIA